MADDSTNISDSSTIEPPARRTWLNHLGLFEGTLSLLLATGSWIATTSVNHIHWIIVTALSIGLALGGVRYGYSFGKVIGWFVLVGMGLTVALLIIVQLCQQLFQ